MPTIALPNRESIVSPTSVVQLEYLSGDGPGPLPKPAAPSSSPNRNWTRFVLLSDTHAQRCDVPDGDVLLHSGDLTQHGTLQELKLTMEWLYALPHRLKIIIAGNHDSVVHREWYEANWDGLFLHRSKDGPEPAEEVLELLKGPRAVAANIVYLQDEQYKFKVWENGKEWSVYGSPWSPYWGDWAFGYEREDGEALISRFPKTDILLTHGPPKNILDFTNGKDRAGCSDLLAALPRLKPRLHVFGHIHEARGAHLHRWQGNSGPPKVQNAIQLGLENKKPPVTKNASDDVDMEDDDETEDKDDGVVILLNTDDDASQVNSGPADGDVGPETIFVNAANYPSGPNAGRKPGRRVKMGGGGFQPMVVDLLE
ncbi:Ser thr protein phosphatase [Favolaschia claudopus]|uniref:Ser thr protein phosphatase n=1 Tax=Favolaschia claudopus TaxID=2862362 RepID=A0AAW0D3U7_9AGAR